MRMRIVAAVLILGSLWFPQVEAHDAVDVTPPGPGCVVPVVQMIRYSGPASGRRLGTGFVVDAKAGLLVTTTHILKGHDPVAIFDPAQGFRDVTMVSADDTTNIALLRVEGGMVCELELASDEPHAGQTVLVFPDGMHASKASPLRGTIVEVDEHFLRFDFSLEGSRSGVPVVDDQGRVVGMAVVIVSKSATKPAPGFGIRLRDLKAALAAAAAKK